MPTYEYRCKKSHVFERFQKMTDTPLKRCDKCKSPVERLIGSGAGLIFKGSGFYITDYKKSADASSKDSPKTETKPSSPAKSEASSKKK